MPNYKDRDWWIQNLQERLEKDAKLVGYSISANFREHHVFSRDELESIIANLISKNKNKIHSSVWERFNQTNKDWNKFCSGFGRASRGESGNFIPSGSNFNLKGITGTRTLKGALMLPCGQDITISKYGKKLAKGIINMQSMVEMWANTRPEILSVISCEIDIDKGIIHEDYVPYLAIEVYVECDLLAFFD